MTQRVGIVTFHHTTNYGAVLQAYGLSTYIRSLGFDVDIIDYRPSRTEKTYWSVRNVLKPGGFANLIKQHNFKKFIRNHLPLSRETYSSYQELREKMPEYDYLICGSDQIWNVSSWRGYDPSYFLGFGDTKKTKKLSYAACVGDTTHFGSHSDEIASHLREFAHLTVRDARSADAVEQLVGIRPDIVVDPVFLGDFDCFTDTYESDDDYVATYAQKMSLDQLLGISEYIAGELKCELRIIGKHIKGYRCYPTAGPIEWLRQLKYSRCNVITSFHGTAISIKFNKPFISVTVPLGQHRLDDLLLRSKLTDNKVSTLEDVRHKTLSLTNVPSYTLYQNEIQKSKDLLKKMLGVP
jgi:hypothetical protein